MPVESTALAAVDLGSNSFRLEIGRVVDDQIYPLDALREPVRLGAGLTRDKRLDRATQLRALEAIARFGERLRGFAPEAVRAVGTNALRVAKNGPQFLEEAQRVLGFPIEVIFGREEARLIYLGVSHSLPVSDRRRLVVDIGGGSTEFIIGTGYEPRLTDSLPMGCVSYSLRFFPDGQIDKTTMKKAVLAAVNEVEGIVAEYGLLGWEEAVASSGTARALANILRDAGWTQGGISAEGLEKLRALFVKAGSVEQTGLNVRPDRVAILPGGLAVMCAVFQTFKLEYMDVSEAALRQGLLYDLLGRVRHHDLRETTVQQFVRRYHVDQPQADRVAALAHRLYDAIVERPQEGERRLLHWAAQLHEIGLSIAQAGYHKHSAYVLSNADMPGFSRDDQAHLARIVLAHRGKLSKLDNLPARSPDWPLVFCLRLATLLYRSRGDVELPAIKCATTQSGFRIILSKGWLDDHPLTAAVLESEAEAWSGVGLRLEVQESAKVAAG